MSLFPIFVKLEGRPVLLVGAGPVGESKIGGLLSAGAVVTVVAPMATPPIQKLAEDGKIVWHQRAFDSRDLDGMTLVVAAVPKEVARLIYEEAQIRGVLVNSVDDPDNCDFYYPAVVNRGDLQIAISTAGHSPALAQRIRIELEQQFGPEYAQWVQQLGDARRDLFATDMDPELRTQRLHELVPAFARRASAGKQDPAYVPMAWSTSLARGREIRNC
jgi:siroheme synthase-like protein